MQDPTAPQDPADNPERRAKVKHYHFYQLIGHNFICDCGHIMPDYNDDEFSGTVSPPLTVPE